MQKQYDVIIIGAGPGGIFCAYELLDKKPDLKVLVIEKGRSIEKRTCPKRVTKQCVWDANPVLSLQALRVQGLFRTANCLYHRMWVEISRIFSAMRKL